jgi:hypothetical protein
MRVKKHILLLSVGLLFINSCIKRIDVATRIEKPILVVEGSVTTDTVPYTVKLSYSGPFTRLGAITDEFIEKDASVTISDDAGNSTDLAYKSNGIYETIDPGFRGKVGRSYSVTIKLKDGRTYTSSPEKIPPSVPISGISADYHFGFPGFFSIYIDTDDPADQENYYNWSFYSWMPRQTHGVGCGFGCIMFEYCFQRWTDTTLRILSDAAINGNKIKGLHLGDSYIYTYGNHYIDIKQNSITREAYQFFERFNEQQSRTGSTLDPLPASIKGNVYNAADKNDFALGYFAAYSVTNRRIILTPYSLTQYVLDISAKQFIPDGPKICFEAFENAMPYPPPPAPQNPPPPGWENAEQIKMYW